MARVALYEELLAHGALPKERRAEIEAALARAKSSGYAIFEEERGVRKR